MVDSMTIQDFCLFLLKVSGIGLTMGFFGAIGMALAFCVVGYLLEIDEEDGVIGH